MNILDNIQFLMDKPNILPIVKTEKVKYFAVALGENVVLKKHKTPVPTTLTVLKGEVLFSFSDRELTLKTFDTFEIPIEEEHEVTGLQGENLFTLIQEL